MKAVYGDTHCILALRLKLGGGGGGSVLVATPDSVHSTFLELQLRTPRHRTHIPLRPLLFLSLGSGSSLGQGLGAVSLAADPNPNPNPSG